MKHPRAIIFALILIFIVVSIGADIYYYNKVKQPPQDGPWQIAYSDFRVFWTAARELQLRYYMNDAYWGTPDYRYGPIYDFTKEFYHFRYSPFVAFAFRPFARLPMGVGLLIWSVFLNICFLLAITLVHILSAQKVRYLGSARFALPVIVSAVTILFYFNNIALGQTDVFIAWLLTLFLFFYVRKGDIACAICLALIVQFKPFFTILPLYFLVSGRRKIPLGAAVAFIALLAIPMFKTGLYEGALLVHDWVKMMNFSIQGQLTNLKNQSFSYMLMSVGGMQGSRPGLLLMSGGICLFFLAILHIMRVEDRIAGREPDPIFEISYLTLVTLLATPLIWKASFMCLVVPFAFVIYTYAGGVKNKAALILFVASVVLTSVVNSDIAKYISFSFFRPLKTIPVGTFCLLLSIVAIHQSAIEDKR